MSRILLDPSMPTGPKFVGGPDLAVLLWFKAMCYSASALSNGFVPESVMYGLVKARRSEVDKALQHLAIVQPGCDNPSLYHRPGGWLLHDYDDPIFANPTRESVAKLQQQRMKSASTAGKASARVRAEKYGTAQPGRVQTPNDSPNEPRTTTFENRSQNATAPPERLPERRSNPNPNGPALRSTTTDVHGDRENVLTKHGDVVTDGADGRSKAALTTRAVNLVDWLLVNRGDHTFSTRKEQVQELATATQMLQLGLSYSDVVARLQSYRDAMDPDDVASSLGYYYGRLQDEAHAALKVPRSHTQTDGPIRITPVLPARKAAKS